VLPPQAFDLTNWPFRPGYSPSPEIDPLPLEPAGGRQFLANSEANFGHQFR